MIKKYDLLEVRNNLGMQSIEIKQIALVNSKDLEAIIYIKIKNINESIKKDIFKLKKTILKIDKNIKVSFKIEIDKELKIDSNLIDLLIFLSNLDNEFLNKVFKENEINILDNNIQIKIYSYMSISDNLRLSFLSKIESFLSLITNKKYIINLKIELVEENTPKIEEIKEEKPRIEIMPAIEKPKAIIKKKPIFKTKLPISNFKDVDSLMLGQEIALRGQIFHIALTETKFGNIRATIYITDNDKSIICNKFLKKEEIDFKLNDIVEVSGRYDKNGEEYSLTLKNITVIENVKEKRKDLAPRTRIELAAHTNMSEMISTIESKELIKRAKEFNHKAIAVTDYGVVHAFPFLAKEVKMDEDFKIIYGIEAYMVDDLEPIINNLKNDELISEKTFVVFDIETTGFNSIEDRIIEIGAIKIKNGKVIDEFSKFVNPKMKIPLKIVELTGINDAMVENAQTIDEVLPKFIEFCNDSILVAHNAKFDIGFINKKSEELKYDIDFEYIDTLKWAKILVKDMKKFGLDALTKKFKIKLEQHHRAIDDAKATAELFKIFLYEIEKMDIKSLNEINDKLKLDPKLADTDNVSILVKNLKGLKRLYELVSISHLNYFADKRPRILKSDILANRENFLISSSPIYNGRYYKGELVNMYIRGMKSKDIEEKMDFYDYVQIYPKSMYNSSIFLEEIPSLKFVEKMNEYFVKMANRKNKIVVATGNVYYLDDKDKESKFALDLASEKSFKTYQIDNENYFKTTNEMLEEFSYLQDCEQIVIDNTYKISDMIEKIKPIPDGEYRPVMEGAEEEVKNMTYSKAYELYGNPLPKVVEDRIKRELDSIIGNGFAVLYLIAQKLVKKSVDNGYLVGSRGSVGSSLVAYLMGITEVNSLYPHYRCDKCKYFEILDFEGSGVDLKEKKCPNCKSKLIRDGHSIPFEVFMGFKGDKTPDIDLNFSGEYQGEVHKYTKELFGNDFVFRAGTISTFAEKNAFIYVKKYYESIKRKEFEKNIFEKYKTVLKKLDPSIRELEENKFKEELDEYLKKNKAQIFKVSQKCEGARKTTGQHPGGMIVVPNYMSIYDFSPVQYPANDEKAGSIITHFDYHVMDQQLVKLDILGHDDPTTLRLLQDLTNVNIYDIPLTDPKVISLFSSSKALGIDAEKTGIKLGTNGIPEFGTDFVKKMLEDTLPKSFAELVRISGLSHGTDVWLNNAQEYVRNKVATLSEVITVRDDIMNHLIDKGMDNSMAFSIMEFVRKGQPTKNKEKWEEYKEKMRECKINDWYIQSCEKIKYMFPKGHAVAYVMMAVRIAYFKVYYPLEFYVAYLNRKYEDFSFKDMYGSVEELKNNLKNKLSLPEIKVNDKKQITLYEILIEMQYRNIEFLPIDIYKSDAMKFKIENGKIRIPLVAMDQLGEVVAKTIVQEREIKKFVSVEDLVKRAKVNKKLIEMLKKLGCIDNDLPESNQLTLF